MRDERVLVTGGAGFIGSNLANELAEQNDVVVVDDEYLGTQANVDESVEYHQASVLEEDLPTDVDVVYHLAALSSTKHHQNNPVRGAEVNVAGFVSVMEKALEFGIEDVVYASSSTVYGNPIIPTHEEVELNPTTRYAASKAARERYAVAYRELGLNMAGCRFFSTYQGYEHQEGHKGEHGNII